MAIKGLDVKALRVKAGANQSDFWFNFGVTQSGSSRYENGRSIPTSLAILIELVQSGQVSQLQLAEANLAVRTRERKYLTKKLKQLNEKK